MRTVSIYTFFFLSSITSLSLNAGKLREDLEKGDTSSLIKRLERNVERRNKEEGTNLENAYAKKIDILCDEIIPQITWLIKKNYKDYIGFIDKNGTLSKFQKACFIVKTMNKNLRKESPLTERGKKRSWSEMSEEESGEKEELRVIPTVSHYSPHNQNEVEILVNAAQSLEPLPFPLLPSINSWYQNPTSYSSLFPTQTQKPPITIVPGRGRQSVEFSEEHQKLLPAVIALAEFGPKIIAERLNISVEDVIACGVHARKSGAIQRKKEAKVAYQKPDSLTFKIVDLLKDGISIVTIADELKDEIPTKNKFKEVNKHKSTAYEWNMITREEWNSGIGKTYKTHRKRFSPKKMIVLTEDN